MSMVLVQQRNVNRIWTEAVCLEVHTGIPVRQRFYTGICDARVPRRVSRLMEMLGAALGKSKFTLRSGGSGTGELALERGASAVHGNREIYLPWAGYNHHSSPLYQIPDNAYKICSSLEPNWLYMGRNSRKLMARQWLQLMGKKLDRPSLFLLCWTPSGKGEGDCADAIALAQHSDIPVIDLGRYDSLEPPETLEAIIEELRPLGIEAHLLSSSYSGQMLLAV